MKKTITAFVHYEKPWHDDDQEAFKVYPFEMSSASTVLVGEQLIEVEVPDDFNPIPAQLAALEREKDAARKAFTDKVMSIDRRISELQAIEFTPEAA